MPARPLTAPQATAALRRFTRLPGTSTRHSLWHPRADESLHDLALNSAGLAAALLVLLALSGAPTTAPALFMLWCALSAGLCAATAWLFSRPFGTPAMGTRLDPAPPEPWAFPGELPEVPGHTWLVDFHASDGHPFPTETVLTLRQDAAPQASVLEVAICRWAMWGDEHRAAKVCARTTATGRQILLITPRRQRVQAGEAVLQAVSEFIQASATLTRFPARIPTAEGTARLEYTRHRQLVTVNHTQIPLPETAFGETGLQRAVGSEWILRRLIQHLKEWQRADDDARAEAKANQRAESRKAARARSRASNVREEMYALAEQRLLRHPLPTDHDAVASRTRGRAGTLS